MNIYDFLDALNGVDDKWIESARTAPMKRPAWTKIGFAAACLAVVLISAVFLNTLINTPNTPTYDGAFVTAEEVGNIFELPSEDLPEYETTYLSQWEIENILNIIPRDEYLNIYKLKDPSLGLSIPDLKEFENTIISKLIPAMGESLDSFERTEEIREESEAMFIKYKKIINNRFTIYLEQQASGHSFDFTPVNKMRITNYADGISLYGNLITIDPTQSKEEILKKFEPTKEKLFVIFGCYFDKVKLDIISNNATICFYNDENMWGVGDSLYLHLADLYGNGSLILSHMEYIEYCVSADSYYYTEAKCKRISLDDAAELLKTGYHFGGHTCDECSVLPDAIVFDDYDYYGFEYLFDRDSEDPRAIPFYTFYKKIGETDGYDRYAKTYVCAVKVRGLEQYFKDQAKNH